MGGNRAYGVRFGAIAAALLVAGAARAGESGGARPATDGWRFAFRDFVIAAWSPPADNDAEYRVYREAGFNIVMGPRHRLPDGALALAQKHGLKVMVDTYAPNDKPWGGTAGPYTPHPSHHPATLPELKWLHQRYGRHPALAGYLLGDDIGVVPPELVQTTRFLRDHAPHLFPWVCQNSHSVGSLAACGNPIGNLQIYPTLYDVDVPVWLQTYRVCRQLDACRQDYRRHGMLMWPMFNVHGVAGDSLVRFQVYASLAYGAQGLWYYTYRGSLQKGCNYKTVEAVRAALEPTWQVAAEANRRVTAWGPTLMGRTAVGLFATGQPPVSAHRPGPGLLIEQMSDDLLVGILAKPGAPPVAMVVDRRVHEKPGAVPEREVTVRFSWAATGVRVLGAADTPTRRGSTVRLTLGGGDGRLLALEGNGLEQAADRLDRTPVARPTRAPVGADGLLLHLAFDETRGGVAHDASPIGNHALVHGTRWVKGKRGGAIAFPGKGAVGVVCDADIPAAEAMSIAVWVRPTYPARGYGAVVYVGTGRGGTDRFEFGFGPDNIYPVISNRQSESRSRLYVSDMKTLIPEGTWGHIAVCAGPDGATTYVNGVARRRTDYVGRFDFAGKNIHLGRRAHERYTGHMDDLRIWNRCLSADEVKALAEP